MDSAEIPQFTANPALRLAGCTDGEQVGRRLASLWQDIDDALQPIIGPRGVLSLYRRSLHVAALRHPWLASGADDNGSRPELTALPALFGRHGSGEAMAAGAAMLESFLTLLVSLIGASLCERLLRSVGNRAEPLADSPGATEPDRKP
jgi:hypothetical protein